MENKIKLDTERWVEERMALLAAPDGWEPDAGVARTRLQGCLSARRPTLARIWLPRVATVALACLVLLFAIPTTRALTQQLWQWLTVQKFEVVQADFQKLRGIWLVPQIDQKEISSDELKLPPVVDFMEAARRAGFTPRLPREGAPPVAPVLMAFDDPMVWSTTLNVANMEASLRQAGVNDQPIPKEWDGAQMSLTTRSAISAVWNSGEMALFQHPPITVSGPAGFDITVYWMGALRAAGVNREQARALAERMRTTPTILLGIAANNKKAIREVNLGAGPATLIETRGEPWKNQQVLLIWSVADRVYHLAAKNAEQAIVAANSIPPEQNAAVVVAGFAAGDKFPIGSYEIFVEDEKSILTFTADGRIVGKKGEGGQVTEGLYTTKGDEIVMKDMKEKRGETEKGCAGEGKYKWSFDGKALSFTKIADDCEGRVRALTAKPLPLVKGKK
ncbi:MAG: hypothetical protein L0312_02190 [Acidobacteria bacterium]|nr:hypothetical protein [Acidobacteriota bacterium]